MTASGANRALYEFRTEPAVAAGTATTGVTTVPFAGTSTTVAAGSWTIASLRSWTGPSVNDMTFSPSETENTAQRDAGRPMLQEHYPVPFHPNGATRAAFEPVR